MATIGRQKTPDQAYTFSVSSCFSSMCLSTPVPQPVFLSLSICVSHVYAASVAESMGGTMGGVLQIFFSAGDAALSSPSPAVEEGGGTAWCRAFVAGVEGVEFYGGAKAGMRTVLDAVVPAADVLRKKGPSGMWLVRLGYVALLMLLFLFYENVSS